MKDEEKAGFECDQNLENKFIQYEIVEEEKNSQPIQNDITVS